MSPKTPLPLPETLKPKYWPTWLALGLLRLAILLPYSTQNAIGRRLGGLIHRFAHKRRRIAEINIQRCFPEKSPAEQAALIAEHFSQLGMMLLDTALSWWARPDTLQKLARIDGLAHLTTALQQRRGVILLTGHMTALDIGGIILGEALSRTDWPMQVMYKRSRNALLEAMMRRGRERFMHRVFIRQDMRSFIKGLKENHPTWYAPDQDFGRNNTVFADFFGIATATLPTPARIAAKTGALVVPYFPIRRADGKGFDIRILPALTNFPTGDDVRDATTINRILEDIVRDHPSQYLWVHRRFKTRPEGEAPFYHSLGKTAPPQ